MWEGRVAKREKRGDGDCPRNDRQKREKQNIMVTGKSQNGGKCKANCEECSKWNFFCFLLS